MGQLSHKRLKRLKGAGKQSFQIPLNHRRSSTKTLFTPCRACALNKQLQKVKKHIQEWCYTHNTYKILSSHIYLFATACFMAQIIKQYLVINTYTLGKPSWKKKMFSFGHCPNYMNIFITVSLEQASYVIQMVLTRSLHGFLYTIRHLTLFQMWTLSDWQSTYWNG